MFGSMLAAIYEGDVEGDVDRPVLASGNDLAPAWYQWEQLFFLLIAGLCLLGFVFFLHWLWPRWLKRKRPCCPKCAYDLSAHVPLTTSDYRTGRRDPALLSEKALAYLLKTRQSAGSAQPEKLTQCPECGQIIHQLKHFFIPLRRRWHLVTAAICICPAMYLCWMYIGLQLDQRQYQQMDAYVNYTTVGLVNWLPPSIHEKLPARFLALHMRVAWLKAHHIDLSKISGRKLKMLSLSMAQIEGHEAISKMTNLKYLNMQYTEWDIDIRPRDLCLPDMSRLKSLNYLNAEMYYELDDISFLRELASLKTLHLAEVKVKDFKPLMHLVNLEELKLKSVHLKSLEGIQSMKRLKRLQIDYASLKDISQLSQCQELTVLRIGSLAEKIDLSPLLHLKQLQSVYVMPGTNISPLPAKTTFKLLHDTSMEFNPPEDFSIAPLLRLKDIDWVHNWYAKNEANSVQSFQNDGLGPY